MPWDMALQVARLVAVVALLAGAALLAAPRGRLPLALRGLWRIMRKDRAEDAAFPGEVRASAWRRLLAFLMVVAAAALAIF